MTTSPNPIGSASANLRSLGDALMRISRMLHEHTRKLEVAVEGTYLGQASDDRVRLLSDSLHVSRTADLELGRLNQTVQRVIASLQEELDLVSTSSPSDNFEREREALNTSIYNLQRQRNELETLYEVYRVLNSTLEFDKVLLLVMDEVIDVVKAERGFLALLNPVTNTPEFKVARDKQQRTIDQSEFEYQISRSTVDRVVRTREPVLTDDAQIDDALKAQESIMAFGIRSIMCVPLVVRDHCIGAVYVDSRLNANLFSAKHRDLLLAFCHQAAIAIDNARLFADLNKALQRVEEDKQYMDNIFASIASGVITTDSSGIINKFNDAAGIILQINPLSAVGRHYQEVFRSLPQVGIIELLQDARVQHSHGTIVPDTVECEITGRGWVNLTLYVSALHDKTQNVLIGMALVIDDRTELKRAEAKDKDIRRIFGRFVHPNVVQQLIENPNALNLGGETQEISVIAADFRGFTSLSERKSSKEVMNLLNTYLEILVKEIWDEGGTVTEFGGNALMAIFNAPLPQEDHVLRAVRAAWKMRMAILAYQRTQPPETHISFGIGVNTGEAMVGNIGSRDRIQNYTAIGDVVNVAARLQQEAKNNNILLNHSTFTRVRKHVRVTKLPPLTVKNEAEPLDVWSLVAVGAKKINQKLTKERERGSGAHKTQVKKLQISDKSTMKQEGTDGVSKLNLLAVAHTELEENNRAYVGKTYSVKLGISQKIPENFMGESFNLLVKNIDKLLSFDILLHTSENIELTIDWHKTLIYDLRNTELHLVEFPFRVLTAGRGFLVVDLYHERRWLRTMRLEFNAVEESQLIAVSSEG